MVFESLLLSDHVVSRPTQGALQPPRNCRRKWFLLNNSFWPREVPCTEVSWVLQKWSIISLFLEPLFEVFDQKRVLLKFLIALFLYKWLVCRGLVLLDQSWVLSFRWHLGLGWVSCEGLAQSLTWQHLLRVINDLSVLSYGALPLIYSVFGWEISWRHRAAILPK
jgi:hypothetical protein